MSEFNWGSWQPQEGDIVEFVRSNDFGLGAIGKIAQVGKFGADYHYVMWHDRGTATFMPPDGRYLKTSLRPAAQTDPKAKVLQEIEAAKLKVTHSKAKLQRLYEALRDLEFTLPVDETYAPGTSLKITIPEGTVYAIKVGVRAWYLVDGTPRYVSWGKIRRMVGTGPVSVSLGYEEVPAKDLTEQIEEG